MACRVGMTTELAERKEHWLSEYPGLKDWTVIFSGLTYEQALEAEEDWAERWGCEAEPGGPYRPGRVWAVYWFFYED